MKIDITDEEYQQVYESLQARARDDIRYWAEALRRLEELHPGMLADVAPLDSVGQAERLRRYGACVPRPLSPMITARDGGGFEVSVQVAEIGWPVVEKTTFIELA